MNQWIIPGRRISRYFLLTILITSSIISFGQNVEKDKQLGAENAKIVDVQI